MNIMLPKSASSHAIAIASKIKLELVENELGTAVLVSMPWMSVHSQTHVVMATNSGRLLAGKLTNDELVSETTLSMDILQELERQRKSTLLCSAHADDWNDDHPFPDDMMSFKTSGIGKLVDNFVGSKFKDDIADETQVTISINYDESGNNIPDKLKEIEIQRRMIRNQILDIMYPTWNEYKSKVFSKLSQAEKKAAECLQNTIIFGWKAFDICTDETKNGDVARTFIWKNQAIGCLILGIPKLYDMVMSGEEDREIFKELAKTNYFVKGAAKQAARLTRLTKKGLIFRPKILFDIAKADIPLDWLPKTGESATDMGYALSVGQNVGSIHFGKTTVPDLEPLSGSRGDWHDFRRRMFEAAKIEDDDDYASTIELMMKARKADTMKKTFFLELVAQSLIVHDQTDAIENLERPAL